MKNTTLATMALVFGGCLTACNPYNTHPTIADVDQRARAETEHRVEQTEIILDGQETSTETVVKTVVDGLGVITEGRFETELAAVRAAADARIDAAMASAAAAIDESRAKMDAELTRISNESVERANANVREIAAVAGSVTGLDGIVARLTGDVDKANEAVDTIRPDMMAALETELAKLTTGPLADVVADVVKLENRQDETAKNGNTGLVGGAGLLGLLGLALKGAGRSRAADDVKEIRTELTALKDDVLLRRNPPADS